MQYVLITKKGIYLIFGTNEHQCALLLFSNQTPTGTTKQISKLRKGKQGLTFCLEKYVLNKSSENVCF